MHVGYKDSIMLLKQIHGQSSQLNKIYKQCCHTTKLVIPILDNLMHIEYHQC